MDNKIYIATGVNRWAKLWKNTEITWNDLVERLKNTVRTAETVAEYRNLKKTEQDNIKDVGGFVGGILKEGRRNAQSVTFRYVLSLDADFAKEDFIDLVKSQLYSDYIIYSTHKHTPENPRLRLIVRLSRPVTAEEYPAVARKVASSIGMDYFDDTTYSPSRLMYWPSTSYDGEFVFDECSLLGGLDVDGTLAEYVDWQDVTQWPVSSRVDKVRISQSKKQGDPLEKNGVIGAFCKTYSIHDAIEKYLSDVYSPCAVADRYTYVGGSTTGGLVTYEDKFAYSNHATDPASQTLCNAFDLVRIHRFAHLDEEAAANTPINRMPSFLEMEKLASSDQEVKKLILTERIESAKDAFEGIEEADKEDDTSWYGLLEMDGKKRCLPTIQNVVTILNNDVRLKDAFQLDDFSKKVMMLKNTPWRKTRKGQMWTDVDDSGLRNYIENIYGISSKIKIEDAWKICVENNKVHPVADYLSSITWDGIPRVDTLICDYLGAENDAYTRAVTRKTLVAAVARILRPGIKFDNMLTLVGPQGLGKSTLVKKLGMKWHTDSVSNVNNKDALEQIQGFWLVEMGELTAMKRAEEEAFKLFLSKTEDNFRKAYGKHTSTYKRQCIFIGTTNQELFLRDKTGNRRFWPVKTAVTPRIKSVFAELDQQEVDQIWAEAKDLFIKGEELYLGRELEAMAIEHQIAHLEESPYAGAVKRYLEMRIPENWDSMDPYERRGYFDTYNDETTNIDRPKISKVCAPMIWVEALGGDIKMLDRMKSKEINDIVRNVEGWKPRIKIRAGSSYGNQRGFIYER